jgi:hypothetical protein
LIGAAERAAAADRDLSGHLAPDAETPSADRVERLVATLPPADAMAAIEHLFGVVPLIEEHFPSRDALRTLLEGERIGALGLFTPEPEAGTGDGTGWPGAALAAEEDPGGGLRISGVLRLPPGEPDGVLALVRVARVARGPAGDANDAGEYRLAWIEPPPGPALDGVRAGDGRVSAPVDLAPDGALPRRIARYAELRGLAAVAIARRAVVALRRAARLAGFQSHQLVATLLTEVEIETDVAASAVRLRLAEAEPGDRDPALSWACGLAAARVLALASETTRALYDRFALEAPDGPFAGPGARGLATGLGGVPFLEHELARSLGVGQPAGGAP